MAETPPPAQPDDSDKAELDDVEIEPDGPIHDESDDPESDETPDVLIDHANREWQSEEVNAARIGAKANIVLSLIVALIGLVLFVLGRDLRTLFSEEPRTSVLLILIAVIATYCMFRALWIVLELGISPRTESRSSRHLFMDDRIADSSVSIPDVHAKKAVLYYVHVAATDLYARNTTRATNLRTAQKYLYAAIILAVACIGIYTWTSLKWLGEDQNESNRPCQPNCGFGCVSMSDCGGNFRCECGVPCPTEPPAPHKDGATTEPGNSENLGSTEAGSSEGEEEG